VVLYFYFKKRPPESGGAKETVALRGRPGAPAKQESVAGPPSSGDGLIIIDADDKQAAAVIAIIAEESGVLPENLKINSIRATGRKTAGQSVADNKYVFEIGEESSGIMKYKVTLNDIAYEVVVENKTAVAEKAAAAAVTPPPAAGEGRTVDAPLAGVIIEVSVKPSDSVKAGQLLCILEALKMENEIVSQYDSVIASVHIQKGDAVNSGSPMFTLT